MTLEKLEAFSENLRQRAGHKQQGLWVPRRCPPWHICHASLCSRDDGSEIAHQPPLHHTSVQAFIDLVCEHMVAVMVRAVTGHPTPKSVLKSASILMRRPCLSAASNSFPQDSVRWWHCLWQRRIYLYLVPGHPVPVTEHLVLGIGRCCI